MKQLFLVLAQAVQAQTLEGAGHMAHNVMILQNRDSISIMGVAQLLRNLKSLSKCRSLHSFINVMASDHTGEQKKETPPVPAAATICGNLET